MKPLKKGLVVKLHKDEPIDSALKRLKDKMEVEGIVDDMKRIRNHESEKKRKMRKARTKKQRYGVQWSFDKREEVYLND